MIKQELINEVTSRTGINEFLVRTVIEESLKVMTDKLNSGEDVIFRNFGSFQIKVRAPKLVRNINTGEEYRMAERKVVVFKPGKELK